MRCLIFFNKALGELPCFPLSAYSCEVEEAGGGGEAEQREQDTQEHNCALSEVYADAEGAENVVQK